MANFSTPQKVLQTIRAGDEVEYVRGVNRTKINNAANNFPPLPEDMAKKLGIKINVNWGEMMILLAHARRQYLSAFMSNQYFFKVGMPMAPAEHQSEWGQFITENINRPMKNSLKYFEVQRSKWSAVVCHGMGPITWYDQDRWCNDYVAIEDVRIPTDARVDFENLDSFAVRMAYTPYELIKRVFSKKRKNHWQKKAIARILKNYKQLNNDYPENHYDWETTPEKLAELMKQDGGYWASTACPAIPLYHFYFRDDTDPQNKGWFMRVVPETGAITGGAPTEEFLWTSEEPICSELSQFFQCQWGDLNNKAPFLVHSTRSLGTALMEPCFYTNLTRCRLLQHVHDNFNIWLQITDPVEKARPQIQEFLNLGVLKQGMNIVPQNMRHQIDGELVQETMAQLKQLQQEASSTYTQQLDTGTKKEQTAYETSVKMQQVNAMLSGLLMVAFQYAKFEYREICRRFCLRKTEDPDVIKFQQACANAKIPKVWMNVDHWDVEPVTPLGMGNPTMAISAANQLMQYINMYPQEAQQEIKHDFTMAVTQDARKAARWNPLGQEKMINDSARDAQLLFGTLMQGVPVPPREELSPADQFDAMATLFAQKIDMIQKRNNMASPDEAAGLQSVAQYLGALIQRLQSNPQEKEAAREKGDAFKQLTNLAKGIVQRGMQAQQKQQGANGDGTDAKTAAQVRNILATGKAKLQVKQAVDTQKIQQNQEKFIREQRRQDAGTWAEIGRQDEMHNTRMKAFDE